MEGLFFGKAYHRLGKSVICMITMAAVILSQLNINGMSVYAEHKDYIKVTAVSPNYYRSYTTEMTFTVEINYNLDKCEQGIVSLGFNTKGPHSVKVYKEETVDKGSGTLKWKVKVTPVDWSSYWKAGYQVLDFLKGYDSMETDFKVYAQLSEYPYDESKEPIALYEFPLEYMTEEAEQMEPELCWNKTNGDDKKDTQNDETGAHDDETDTQDFADLDADHKDVFETKKFDSSLEELCSMTASDEYNPKLAYMLMTLAGGAYYKQCTIKNYEALGFPKRDYDITYNYFKDPDDDRYGDDSVAYAIDDKMTWDGRRMVLITIRGSYGRIETAPISKDWKSNFNLGEAETGISWHCGFEKAAKEVFEELKLRYGSQLPTDNTFYVITGHSRGAGVANLLSILISDNGVPKLNVYDYNFACPDVARNIGTGWNWLGDHDNMFNVGNAADLVTWIPGVLGDLLGDASDSAVSLYSLVDGKDLEISGSKDKGLTVPKTDWGKFGRSYWFSEDWNHVDGLKIDFEPHRVDKYMNYLGEHSEDAVGTGEMVTWEGVLDRSTIGKVLAVVGTGLLLFVLCPVDVTVKDADGNVVASVVDGEIDYHGTDFGDVIILTEGDRKLIYLKDGETSDVELKGTDDGSMTYIAAKADMLTEEINAIEIYEDVAIKKGKRMSSHVELTQNGENQILSELTVVNRFGRTIAEVQEDGKEIAVKGSLMAKIADRIWIFVIAGIALALLATVLIILARARRSNRANTSIPDMQSDLSIPMGGGMQQGDILCTCGTINPAGVRSCMGCGKKLKRR